MYLGQKTIPDSQAVSILILLPLERWQDQREMVIENGRDVINQLKEVQVSDEVSGAGQRSPTVSWLTWSHF